MKRPCLSAILSAFLLIPVFADNPAMELERAKLSLSTLQKQYLALKEKDQLFSECMETRFEQAASILELCTRDLKAQDLAFVRRELNDFNVFRHFLLQKIKLHAVGKEKAVRLNVRSFGAKGDGVQDDAPAFAAVLQKARALDPKPVVIEIPAGKYFLAGRRNFPAGSLMKDVRNGDGTMKCTMSFPANLLIADFRHLTLEGEPDQTELLFDAVGYDGLSVVGARNVTIRNLILRCRRQTFSQGTIVRLEPETDSLELLVDPRYPLPKKPIGLCQVYDGKTGKLLRGGATGKWYDKMTHVEGNRWKLHISRALGSATDKLYKLEVGQTFVIPFRQHGTVFRVMESAYCTFENIAVQNSFDTGFFLGLNDGNIFFNCRVEPAPGTLISTCADAFHCFRPVGIGAYLKNCRTRNMGDDAFNSYCSGQAMMKAVGNRLWIRYTPGGVLAGDLIAYVSPVDGSIKGYARIAAQKRCRIEKSDCLELTLNQPVPPNLVTYQSLNIPEYTSAEIKKMVHGGKIGKEPDLVYPVSKGGIGIVVRDCDFASNRNNGAAAQIAHGRFYNNKFENLNIGLRSGVFLTWKEGFLPYNIVIRNNTFTDNWLGIQVSCVAKDNRPVKTAMFRDYTIENNTFRNSAVELSNLKNSTFRGNRFLGRSGGKPIIRACENLRVEK